MAQASRTSSRHSLMTEKNTNRSNSNLTNKKRPSSTEIAKQEIRKQISSSSLRILGQDGEVSEEVILNGSLSDRSTPVSNRTRLGSGSTSRRTPTPSKQISLQAVKRKEENSELLEPINWNDIDQPVQIEDRIPKLPVSDSDSDTLSPRDTPLSEAERLTQVEKRTRQMTTALSTARVDHAEADLSRKLDLIETAREERERKEKEKQSAHKLTVEDGQFTYRNEHFRDLSHRDHKDKIDSDFILDGTGGAYYNESVTVGPQPPVKRRGANTIGRHPMDKPQETAITLDSKQPSQNESNKKNEAGKDVESSSDEDSDDDEEEEDLIGERGRAPNALLMEFLSSMMEEDYEMAEKLCKMILIYEPENPEALSFFPLIQEKLRQEAEEEDDDDESDDESDDSGEEEDSNEEDDDDDDEDDDNEDDEEDDEENESSEGEDDENAPGNQPDSGIASANSD